MVIKRHYWLNLIEKCFKSRNIIWLHGVRRCGKTFLCRSIKGIKYFDCEIPSVRREVEDESFLENHKNQIIALDEIHRLAKPYQILKIAADYYPNTKIIATGSSTLGVYKRFRDTLTGRKYDINLTPMIWSDMKDFNVTDINKRLEKGGLPPFILDKNKSVKNYNEWLDSFWARDIQELFHLTKRYSFLKFIELLLVNSGGIFEATSYAALCEVSRPTIKNYLAVLDLSSIISEVRPFSRRKTNEIVLAPKIYGFDTGFISFARSWDKIREDDFGILWEHMVLNELIAVLQSKKVFYWRDKAGHEVDFILCNKQSFLTAIECKWQTKNFNPGNLKIFRKKYVSGENVLLAQDCVKPYTISSAGMRIKVIGIKDIGKMFKI